VRNEKRKMLRERRDGEERKGKDKGERELMRGRFHIREQPISLSAGGQTKPPQR